MVIVLFFIFRAHWRADGARDAEIATFKAAGKAQQVTIKTDSVILVKHDTVKVFRDVARTDTVLQSLIDLRHDTVWVTREVLIEAKAALDSTKKTADACCQLARDYRAKAATLDSLNKDLLKKIPWGGKSWIDRAEGALVCAGAVYLARK